MILDKGKKAAVVTLMNNGDGGRGSLPRKIILTEEQLCTSQMNHHLDETIVNKAQFALETGNIQFYEASVGAGILIEPYFPEARLIVLGGGHIAKPLAEFGSKVGFLVTVVDDRPMFANKDRFPDAEKVICESFSNCFMQLKLNESSFVVIVTRGHRHDLDCLQQVLKYKTAYTGMIGSKRRVKGVKEQLFSEGYPVELINAVNAPIGLEIGAITPEEIAISIIAQVISYRRLVSTSSDNTASVKVNWPELDRPVLEELSKDNGDPKALITVISTIGSVPRKAGAKMLVWPYGKILGSIGGGCSEGEVINTARQMIGSGGLKVQDIDMTGQIAEDEGMVCGGIMRVLIEDYHG
ncbi:XdhC/CoxI family protein [Dehalobacter sp. DCM]|uniref:XdhC/CoxI family protein n=1 Tax=Dehalobacter sp. DCM TaxID=2907827 RepID=UPI0030813987